MNFQPALPIGGLAGWSILNSTLDRQTEIFNQSPLVMRDTEYFEDRIALVSSAEELVSDRRLLRVALGAFGLLDDLNNRAFLKKILEDGTTADDALANRLADKRYADFTDAFGFAETSDPNTKNPGFGTQITESFRRREFEIAVGEQDQAMRLAMNAKRELAEIASEEIGEKSKWLRILGTPPLRSVFETALSLPDGFAQLDIDLQVDEIKNRAVRRLGIGSINDLVDADLRENVVRQFLLQDQVSEIAPQSSSAIALSILRSASGFY